MDDESTVVPMFDDEDDEHETGADYNSKHNTDQHGQSDAYNTSSTTCDMSHILKRNVSLHLDSKFWS